jgi:hypothetical protein
MPLTPKEEALNQAAHVLINVRAKYGGDGSLKDVRGKEIVAALVYATQYPEFSQRANTVIALFAKLALDNEALDPHVED